MSIAAVLAPLVAGLVGLALPPTHAISLRADAAARDVAEAVADLPEVEREAYARAAFTWGFYEAGWYADPVGSNDLGAACGVMQVHTPERWLPGATCAKCGSLRAALTAYATDGRCHAWTLPLVVKRMKQAGIE